MYFLSRASGFVLGFVDLQEGIAVNVMEVGHEELCLFSRTVLSFVLAFPHEISSEPIDEGSEGFALFLFWCCLLVLCILKLWVK